MSNSSLNNPFQPQNLGLNAAAAIGLSAGVQHTATQPGWVLWGAYNTTNGQFTFNGFNFGMASGVVNKWADSNSICVYVSPGDTYSCTGASIFIFFPLKGA